MNGSIKKIMKNIGFSLTANGLSMIISSLMVVIVPKVIGVAEYGYWQLYLFYASYVGFFHLGWCDGIYLRYAGKKKKELDNKIISSQFWGLIIYEIIISIILYVIIFLLSVEQEKLYVLIMTIIALQIILPKAMLIYILQTTNNIKQYSFVVISEKIVLAILTMVFLILKFNNFEIYLIGDLLAKFISLVIAILYCKDLVKFQKIDFEVFSSETKKNLKAGSKLMLANVAGMLILGVVKIYIENRWSIETFGKISLSFNISNLLLVFINAMGVVIFPMLKKMGRDKLSRIYITIRNILMLIILTGLTVYFPINSFLSGWLPKYSESLSYLAILFPICVYESKMSLLINTYLKALRKENLMLQINLSSVLLSFIMIAIVNLLNNLSLLLIGTVFIFAFRCIYAEIMLSQELEIKFVKEIIIELLISISFVICTSILSNFVGIIIYAIILLWYWWMKKDFIKKTIKSIKNFRRGEINE